MSFYDYASTRLFEITQKSPADLKLLLSSQEEHPRLLRNENGYKIILPKPVKIKTGAFLLHGAEFPEDERAPLLQMFTASVYHLGIHVVASDFTIYEKWSRKKDRYLAGFAKSLVEDAAVDAYLRAYWPGLRSVIAYANANSYVRLRGAGDQEIPHGLALHQDVLSRQLIGSCKGAALETSKDAENIMNILADLERSIGKWFEAREGEESKPGSKGRLPPRATEQDRLEAASKIWEILHGKDSPLETPSPPYCDYWGGNSLFNSPFSFEENHIDVLKVSYSRMDLNVVEEEFMKEQTGFKEEADRIFDVEFVNSGRVEKALKQYNEMGAGLNFRSYVIPAEDYSEYIRTRGILAGAIRRILDETRKIKQVQDDNPLEEAGALDLQAAIQVIASQSARNDIFMKEEVLQKSEAWAILVDASLSLRMFELDVRSIAVCLAEVAKDLVSSPNSWGLFAFNDTYQIVKDFYEPYSNKSRAKIGGLKHSGLSYIPDAVELTTKALAKTGEDVKVLLLVTDGVPLGYPGIEQRLKDSFAKARASNVTPVVIGLGNQKVKQIFKPNPSCSIDGAAELMKQFVKMYFEMQSCM
ncbi:MAG: VWA domain-containing protein [Thaumarchaeota archaeon]|nr:VWA domain-containing protein [Nitrososphaerota archaeon]MCL5318377.1 VWA domain-containing protein [Nitrososphaerota archaeon]